MDRSVKMMVATIAVMVLAFIGLSMMTADDTDAAADEYWYDSNNNQYGIWGVDNTLEVRAYGGQTPSGSGVTGVYTSTESVNDHWSTFTNLIFDNYITGIGDYTFNGCACLETVTLNDGLLTIGDYAFAGCTELTSITIPDTVTSIGANAFEGCSSLTTVIIGSGVQSIGDGAFNRCVSITSLTVDSGNTYFKNGSDNDILSKDGTTLVSCPCADSYTVPATVTTISSYAFMNNNNLTDVTIPASTITIGTYPFHNCYELQSISVDSGNTAYKDVNGVLFNKTGTELVLYPSNKSGDNYTIPAGTSTLGAYSFHISRNLKDITVPATVTTIKEYALSSYTLAGKETITFLSTTPATNDCNYGDITLYVPNVSAYRTAWASYSSYIYQKITYNADDNTYDGNEKTLLDTAQVTIDSGTNSATDAGSYSVTATPKYSDGYVWDDGTYAQRTIVWEITPITITDANLELWWQYPITYGDSPNCPDFTDFYFTTDPSTPAITSSDISITVKDGTDWPNVGTHYAVLSTTNSNYVFGSEVSTEHAFEIEEKKLTVTPTASQSGTYNGTTSYDIAYTYSGNITGQTPAFSGKLGVSDKNIGTRNVTLGTLALTDNGDFKASNYELELSATTVTFEITAKTITITSVTATSRAYDGSTTVTLTGGTLQDVESGDTVTFTLGNGTASDKDVGTDIAVTTSITLTGDDCGNYTLTQPTDVKVNITAKTLTVTPIANAKFYGETDPELTYTYSGQISGETPDFSGSLKRASGNDVGTYVISNDDLALADNGDFKASNYSMDVTSGVIFKIYKATIGITADSSQSKTYGDADPTLTFTYSGQQYSETPAFTGALSRDTGENVGKYNLTIGSLSLIDNGDFKASNYDLGFTIAIPPIQFEITKRTITVTPDSGQSKGFLYIDPNLTYTYSGNIEGETPGFTGALSRNEGEDAGDYMIVKGSLALTDNGDFKASNHSMEVAEVYFTITKATITVTPNSGQSKVYGTSDPTFKYSYSGCMDLDQPKFTGELSRETGSDVGDYEITKGTLALSDNGSFNASNYNLVLSSTPVEFKITKKNIGINDVTAATRAYDGSTTVSLNGGALVDVVEGDEPNVSFTLGNGTVDKDVGTSKPVTTSIELTGSKSDNYELVQPTYITVDITARTLSVLPESGQSKVYGTSDPVLSYVPSGEVPGEIPDFTGALKRANGENVGTYAISNDDLALADNGDFKASNYSLNVVATVTFAITKATITVTPDPDQGKIYLAQEPLLTYGYAGQYDTQIPGFSGELTRDAGESIGSYDIKKGTLALKDNGDFLVSNYDLAFTEGVKFTISVKTIVPGDFTIDLGDEVYTGSEITKKITSDLKLDTEYSVAYSNNINVGKADIILSGIGNYSGTVVKSFNIVKRTVTVPEELYYIETGSEIAFQIPVSSYYTETTGTPQKGTEPGTYTYKFLLDPNCQWSVSTFDGTYCVYITQKWVKHVNSDGVTDVLISGTKGIRADYTLKVETTSNSSELQDKYKFSEGTPRYCYDITFLKDGKIVQPVGTLTVTLLIPDNIRTMILDVYHVHGDSMTKLEKTVDGDYATVQVNEVSEFVFVSHSDSNIMIILSVAGAILILVALYLILIRKGKTEKEPKVKKKSSKS